MIIIKVEGRRQIPENDDLSGKTLCEKICGPKPVYGKFSDVSTVQNVKSNGKDSTAKLVNTRKCSATGEICIYEASN